MSSLEAVIKALDNLSLKANATSHPEVDSLKAWTEAVKALDSKLGPTKTLVLKPGKGPNSNLILVVSLDSTSLSVNTLAKSLGYKDARMAGDDLVTSTFQTDKLNRTILFLTISYSICSGKCSRCFWSHCCC